jgi:hypothetical protein
MEIVMTLEGLKPYTLFAFYDDQGILVFDRLVCACLLLLMAQYRLEEYGFVLQKIDHDTPTTVHKGFRNGWIFGGTRSDLWSLAKDVFLVPHPGCARSNDNVGLALSYPVHGGGIHRENIFYEDATEQEELRKATGGEIRCVIAYEYDAQDEKETCDMMTIHLIMALKIAKNAGRTLKVDFSDHPSVGKNYVAYMEKLLLQGRHERNRFSEL